MKSVVNRVATQLERALHEKGLAFLVNHGISEEKVKINLNSYWGRVAKEALRDKDHFRFVGNEKKEINIRSNLIFQLKSAWGHLDDFCKLPKDTKELYIRKAPDNHGYVQPGIERFDGVTPELRHAFNICTLNVANLPEEPLPGFREHISDLATDFKSLSSLLLQALAIGLGRFPMTAFLRK